MTAFDDFLTAKAQVQCTTDHGIPLVIVSGELDISNASVVADQFAPLLRSNPEKLIFDLSELQFMDSSGIAILLVAAEQIPYVEIREASAIVRRLIEVTGLQGTLHLGS